MARWAKWCWRRSTTRGIIKMIFGSIPIDADARPGENLDWKAWLGPAPKRPFDPDRCFSWRRYWDYSGGIASDLFIHRVTRIIKALDLKFPSYGVGRRRKIRVYAKPRRDSRHVQYSARLSGRSDACNSSLRWPTARRWITCCAATMRRCSSRGPVSRSRPDRHWRLEGGDRP